MNRIRAGYALVRNAGRPNMIHRVPLDLPSVDMIVFSTKDPGPMLDSFRELKDMGYSMSFHITVNAYGRDLEPNVPDWQSVVESVREVSGIVGRDMITWRYDPIIVNDRYDLRFHRDSFRAIAEGLEGSVSRCSYSFLSTYSKLVDYISMGLIRAPDAVESRAFVEDAVSVAASHGMHMTCCPASHGLIQWIETEACIGPECMRRWGVPYRMPSTPSRKGCGCVEMEEVGIYDSCFHDCVYCYANAPNRIRRSRKEYDPQGEMLYGTPGKDDIILDRRVPNRRLTDFL